MPSCYYYVQATDLNGHEYQTFPFLGQPNDQTPPGQPTLLTGTCSKNGVVTLTWARNPEPDMLGYRIFMSSVMDGDFAQVTGSWVSDTAYRHQVDLATLTGEMYFAVKALDLRQNPSPMSLPLMVTLADIVPPAAPVIGKAWGTANGVYLEWSLSPSADVESHYLERREAGLPYWGRVTEFGPQNPPLTFTDTSASKRKKYEYRLVAVDDAGLESSSVAVKVKPADTGLRGTIQNFAGQLMAAPKSVVLQWQYEDDPDLIGFEIFRAIQHPSKQRSYAYMKMPPPPPSGSSSQSGLAVLNGNTWQCAYTDKDVKFAIHHQNTFVVFPNPNAAVNQAVPAPAPPPAGAGNNVGAVVVPNPNNLAGTGLQQPTLLFYWVMAKYHDGGYSPVAGPVQINFQ